MLVKADARFRGDPGRVGIKGPEKTLDLLLHSFLLHSLLLNLLPHVRGTGQDNFSWLDLIVHFRLHPHSSPRNLA